jgi:hypothetical protein
MHICLVKLISQNKSASNLPFELRAAAALGISLVADGLDYVGAPIFALPIVGDIADAIVMTMLYKLTGSKTSAALNLIEFIPFIGDMVPTYTISTLLWILKELRIRKDGTLHLISERQKRSAATIPLLIDGRNVVDMQNKEDLKTKLRRKYLIMRSRIR